MRTNYLTAIAAMSLVSCASVYVEPQGPDVAILSIRNDTNGNVLTQAFKVAEDCSGGKVAFGQSMLLRPHEATTAKVQANRPFSFYVNQVSGMMGCKMALTFIPKDGRRYTVSYSAENEKCFANMTIASPNGETHEPTFRKRAWNTPLLETGSFCS